MYFMSLITYLSLLLFCSFIYYFTLDLLAIRSAEPWPEDPLEHLRDYFGRQRDPLWDLVE